MNLERVHLKYIELDKNDVIREGDTTSFSQAAFEIERIYDWEEAYYHAEEYRKQLPEETQKSIVNEFDSAINIFLQITQLRRDNVGGLDAQKLDLTNNIKRLYKTLYDIFIQDYRGWRIENQESGLVEEFEERVRQAQLDLNKRARETEKSVSEKGEQAVTKIVGVDTTEEWAREYSQYINPDSHIRSLAQVNQRNYQQARSKFKGRFKVFRLYFLWFKNWISKIFILKFRGIIFYTGHSYLNTSARWRFWRSLFYVILFILATVYLLHFLIAGGPERNRLPDYFIEKLAFLPLIVITSIGLVFAGKNYRINSNLLEDYKHRYVVAKTIQNLLRLPTIQNNTRLQTQLLEVGAQILFAHRASGYMGHDSDEKLLDSFISRFNVTSGPK